MPSDLNVIHASQLAIVRDSGSPRRGEAQGELDLVPDGAVAIRNGVIAASGSTSDVLREAGADAPTLDASGMTVLPALVECHSHPMFGGDRYWEYPRRIRGASSAAIRAEGGGIWSTVIATREASDESLLSRAAAYYRDVLAGGVATLEVKSGYGLTTAQELRLLRLLKQSAARTSLDLVVTFLGAHIAPRDGPSAEDYARVVRDEMLPAVLAQGIAEFQDLSCETGDFDAPIAAGLLAASRRAGLRARVHADASSPSGGWRTAVEGGAIAADHLTYTPREEILAVGRTDTIAILLPLAEQYYLDDKRALARCFVETGVPVAIATDYCSSFQATSLTLAIAMACSWFRLTPSEAIVGATLNAAYALGRGGDRGSLDPGKRGDLAIFSCAHPQEIGLRIGAPIVDRVISRGDVVFGQAI
jgi:imidazolonepropionase